MLAWYRACREHDLVLPEGACMGGDKFVAAVAGEEVEERLGDEVRDTPWDVEAARKAGVATICVLTGGFCEQELRELARLSSSTRSRRCAADCETQLVA